MFLAFDLLHQDGVDLRGLPLTERKRIWKGSAARPGCPISAWSRLSRWRGPVRALQ